MPQGYLCERDRRRRRSRVPRLPRGLVLRGWCGAVRRVLTGLFRQHEWPLRVHTMRGRDLPEQQKRHGVPTVRGGQLLRRGRVIAAAVQEGHVLERHKPLGRLRVRRRLAGPLCHHGLHRADAVRQGVVHGRAQAGQVHALRRRHLPGRGGQDGVLAVPKGFLLPSRRGGVAPLPRRKAHRPLPPGDDEHRRLHHVPCWHLLPARLGQRHRMRPRIKLLGGSWSLRSLSSGILVEQGQRVLLRVPCRLLRRNRGQRAVLTVSSGRDKRAQWKCQLHDLRRGHLQRVIGRDGV
mmetsp:Transcript_25063/g.74490  ORF Transcript_25063/g.74490 Transcript_25063/m.74490 type:complete len:292 (+) Transcript_25063:1912-2787(+)